MNVKYQFLSHILANETVGYGGKKEFQTIRTLSIEKGDSCNQSEWKLCNHIGTHVDAAFHFSNNGKTIDQLPASFWIFNHVCLVDIPVENSKIIEVGSWVESIPINTELLILKTGFEKHRDTENYWAHNPGLSPELGVWLRKNRLQLRAIGFDFISITSYDNRPLGKVAHKAFLHEENVGNPILAIEDMHLINLIANPKRVIISPLRVLESDGSPVTVFAEL